jgi:hypothetical protein
MAQLDNIPAMLKSGEYVVRKEAVDEIGKENMDMINNIDRLGYMGGGLVPQGEHGHSAIDELLALNTLANQRSVDMDRQTSMMNKGGKVLKKAPEGNKGLMNLPEEVRNRMGYMKEGGMMDNYMYGGMSKKKKNEYREGGLGVQDKLAMAMDEFQDIENLLSYASPSEYSFPKSQRDMLDYLQESGQTDVSKALEALDLIQKRYQEGSVGFHMPRYQEGGLMNYQDGGYSPSDSINEYYDTFGFKPTDPETRKQFENLYAYDPTEALGDVGQLRADISQELATATADTSSYGMGFDKFGGRKKSIEDIRKRAQKEYETDSTGIMETSKADSEADALQFLAQVQQSDAGMEEFSSVDPTKASRSFQPGASIGDFTFPENPEEADTVITPSGRYYVYNAGTGLWERQN